MAAIVQPDGAVVQVLVYTAFGAEAALSPLEEARLDAEGALAPVGASLEDVIAEREQTQLAFQTARRNLQVDF